jgi:propionyl-CoA carboxylase alpha chain
MFNLRRPISGLARIPMGRASVGRPARTPVLTPAWTRLFSSENMKYFDKVLVANRGEIACRVMETCRKHGIKTVAVFSDADRYSKHVAMADEAVHLGGSASSESYLDMDKILTAVTQTGAQAVHPGYGFLSENHTFANMLADNGIAFVGPREKAIVAMGDKIASKQIARDANVDTVPGFLGALESDEEVLKVANEIGYPVMIKASAGGGGKGMRVAWNDEEAIEGFRFSKAEAISAFGDDTIFLEKFIEDPRHIEIQVLCDAHGNGVYLNERECSIQRRNQKVIEEAPSVFLTPETRKAMGEQAVALAHAVDYQSAGTVEFLVDKHSKFYFLEMNTRLQVEHPVTEKITGVDLVEQMLRVAAGHRLEIKQDDVQLKGWAFESRVYAEDPYRNFLPSIGRLTRYSEPGEQGEDGDVRCDSGIREGDDISIYYDPMICKLITYGPDRAAALEKMRVALDSYVIQGVNHNICFLRSLCDHPRFISGEITTKFIEEEYPEGYQGHSLTAEEKITLAATTIGVHAQHLDNAASTTGSSLNFEPSDFVAERIENLVLGMGGGEEGEAELTATVTTNSEGWFRVVLGGEEYHVMCSFLYGDDLITTTISKEGGETTTTTLQLSTADTFTNSYTLTLKGTKYPVRVWTAKENALKTHMPVKAVVDTSKLVLSPMPGRVVSVNVKVGDSVVAGQEVCVVEAMKMQNVLRCENDAVVKSIPAEEGETVSADQTLIEFE